MLYFLMSRIYVSGCLAVLFVLYFIFFLSFSAVTSPLLYVHMLYWFMLTGHGHGAWTSGIKDPARRKVQAFTPAPERGFETFYCFSYSSLSWNKNGLVG